MFMGTEFVWFTGIVENANNDPLKLGRVQVRIFGIHSDKLVEDNSTGEGIPTNKLPWAVPLMPVNGPSISGIGQSPTGLVNGTTVMGFARDGALYNDLIIMGTLNGIPQSPPQSELGFNDPDLKYPLETHIEESDVNRLARNEKIDETIVQSKIDNIETTIPKSIFSGTELAPVEESSEEPEEEDEDNPIHDTPTEWDEPTTPYNAEYPYNEVYESRAGHITEIDNTPENERLHEYHKSGTFNEIYPDGSKVRKIIGSDYEVVINNKNILVKGNMSVTVEGDSQVYIKGNNVKLVDGNSQHEIVGIYDKKVSSDKTEHIYGNHTSRVDAELDELVNGNVKQEYMQDELKDVVGNLVHNIGGDYLTDAEGHYEIQAPTLNLGIQSMEPAVLGDKLDSLLNHLIDKFNNHTHIGNMGTPTSNPNALGHIQQYSDPKSGSVNVQA